MKNIKELPDGYQVVIVRFKKEITKFFRYSMGIRKAKKRAQQYRDLIFTLYPDKHFPFRIAYIHSNTGKMGVSRCVSFDKRRNKYYVSYSAHFTDWNTGKPNNKSFHCGEENKVTKIKEDCAYELACEFRDKWENDIMIDCGIKRHGIYFKII